ncbi:hypothetical protein LINPERHAP2_LOCUS12766 [Linum perenne]
MAGRKSMIKIVAVVWNVWKTRNEFVFRGTSPSSFSYDLKISQDYSYWTETSAPDESLIVAQNPDWYLFLLVGYGGRSESNHGSFLASSFSTGLTLVLSDSLPLVNVLNNALSPWPWDCATFIAHMVQTLSSYPWIAVEFTPRAHNSMTNRVASKNRKHSLPDD